MMGAVVEKVPHGQHTSAIAAPRIHLELSWEQVLIAGSSWLPSVASTLAEVHLIELVKDKDAWKNGCKRI
jgi:hypothetical protein